MSERRLVNLPTGVVVKVGTQSTHPSHALSILKGLTFCTRCGQYFVTELHALALPCLCAGSVAARTLAGVDNINRLTKGLPPRNLVRFPSEAEAEASGSEELQIVPGLILQYS